jgi:hypothetical protein
LVDILKDYAALPVVEISWGEFFDRLTILQIKLEKLQDPDRLTSVQTMLNSLAESGRELESFPVDIQHSARALKEVNSKLWDIEEGKRQCERKKDFGSEFVALARSVYIENDKRAQLKREIDLKLGSRLIEVKSYKPY